MRKSQSEKVVYIIIPSVWHSEKCLQGVRSGGRVWLRRDSMEELFEVIELVFILIAVLVIQIYIDVLKLIEFYIQKMINFTVGKLKNNKSNNIKVKKKITKYLRGNGQDHLGFNGLGQDNFSVTRCPHLVKY